MQTADALAHAAAQAPSQTGPACRPKSQSQEKNLQMRGHAVSRPRGPQTFDHPPGSPCATDRPLRPFLRGLRIVVRGAIPFRAVEGREVCPTILALDDMVEDQPTTSAADTAPDAAMHRDRLGPMVSPIGLPLGRGIEPFRDFGQRLQPGRRGLQPARHRLQPDHAINPFAIPKTPAGGRAEARRPLKVRRGCTEPNRAPPPGCALPQHISMNTPITAQTDKVYFTAQSEKRLTRCSGRNQAFSGFPCFTHSYSR